MLKVLMIGIYISAHGLSNTKKIIAEVAKLLKIEIKRRKEKEKL